MEWVETTGRTLADAVDAALDQLGVAEDDLEYEVLDEPKTGLLGRLGGREARIRARVKPISREKPGDRRRRDRRPRPAGGRGGEARRRPAGDGEEATAAPLREREGSGAQRSSGSRPRRRRPRRPAHEQATGVATDEGATMEESDIPIEDQAETAEGFTRGLVEAFGADAQVETRIDDEIILVDVTGANLGLLVGPRGATLSALEELVRTVVQRHTGGHGARINVDVGGYRAKRRQALSEFTQDLARKVLETGQEQALEPMSASDRKVVHDAVAEMDGVTTGSEGEEPRRRVVIRPA
jgi:spoIIIJ-associated protein